jgi:hypothetical protein
MCRKLGKGHPDYVCRKDNQYELDENGIARMRRMHNGRRVVDHHGANVLNAYTDLRDKFWSWVPDRPGDIVLKVSARKTKHLARMERHTNHGMSRGWPKRRAHLTRNNVCVVSYLRDNRS